MLARRVQEYFKDRMVRNYDRMLRPFERRTFGESRHRLLRHAEGRVLDLGAGTGANFAYYPREVRHVVALDPELGMLATADGKREAATVPVVIVAGSAESLPFPDATFDTVVATLVFCTIGDPGRAIAEVARVLAPGGRVLMLEHVRSSNPLLGIVMDAATPLQRLVAAGCHLNRKTHGLVARAGFSVEVLRRRALGCVVEIEAIRPAQLQPLGS